MHPTTCSGARVARARHSAQGRRFLTQAQRRKSAESDVLSEKYVQQVSSSERNLREPVTYLRSALTYGAIFYLTGLLLLFFGGLSIGSGEVPDGRSVGWAGEMTSVSVGWARGIAEATGLSAFLSALAELLPGEGGRAHWRGIAVLSTVPPLAAGMLVACWAEASWGESAAAFAFCVAGLLVFGSGGFEGLWHLLQDIAWSWERIWDEAFGGRLSPGWGAALPISAHLHSKPEPEEPKTRQARRG
jgi:hypothetical protein